MIAFACPTCGEKIEVPEATAGQVTRCRCGEKVKVPQMGIGKPLPAENSKCPTAEMPEVLPLPTPHLSNARPAPLSAISILAGILALIFSSFGALSLGLTALGFSAPAV